VKKIVLCALIIILTLFIADYVSVFQNYNKPIIARITNGADDGGSGLYKGIGYSIYIEGNFMPEDTTPGVTEATLTIFGYDIVSLKHD
jgi:hypothetical protein